MDLSHSQHKTVFAAIHKGSVKIHWAFSLFPPLDLSWNDIASVLNFEIEAVANMTMNALPDAATMIEDGLLIQRWSTFTARL